MDSLLSFASLLLLTASLSGSILGSPGPFPQGEDPDGTKYKTAYKCEGDHIFIRCDVSETIRVIRANYGRFSIAICNKHGYTDWSVNCMSPRTTRVFQNKCDGRMNCSMPVNSNVFGDPCPQTQKYVEVHYACIPKFRTTTTKKPLPPWFLENGASELWNSQISLESAEASFSSASPTSSTTKQRDDGSLISHSTLTPSAMDDRRPIMVTKPSTTPLRIPITTPRIITTPSVSSSSSSKEVEEEDGITTEAVTPDSSLVSTDSPPNLAYDSFMDASEFPLIEETESIEIINMDSEDLQNLCSSKESRNVVWPWTQKGDIAIVQCPPGATGLARWACIEDESGFGSEWAGSQPDMSDCKSVGMTDLEVRVREKETERGLAYSLAHLTNSKDLYGGDLESSVAVLRAISNRINYLFTKDEDSFEAEESYIQETFQNVIRSAGNLIARKHREAWLDLHRSSQMKIANSLILSLQENALLLAKVIDTPEFLEEISTNIMMALSVNKVTTNSNGTGYPLKSSSSNRVFDQWLQEDSIYIDQSTLEAHTGQDNLAKIIYFSYQDLDEILTNGEKNFLKTPYMGQILNSRIISSSVAGYKFGVKTSSPGITVTLSHLIPNASNPVCVVWDLDLHAWSDEGCVVEEHDPTGRKTVCKCDRFSNYALMMTLPGKTLIGDSGQRAIEAPGLSQSTILTLEIAIYVAATLSLIFISIIIFRYRLKIYKLLMKYDCFKDEKKPGLGSCPKSQSFYNGVNLMSSNSQQNVVPYKSTLSRFITDPDSGYSNGSLAPKAYKSYHIEDEDPLHATKQLRDVVYMSPQLSQLTNTLKAKKKHCNGDHFTLEASHRSHVDCHHSMKNDDTILPEKEVVFRAVSPHGHVYWEIDPKKEEESTTSDDVSRQSSHRYSDNRSLIRDEDEEGRVVSPSSSSSPANVLVNPFAELSMISESSSNSHMQLSDPGRFHSLRPQSSTHQQQQLHAPFMAPSNTTFRRTSGDELQRQVQIRDIRSIPASVKSNDYILAKIQNHMGRAPSHNQGQIFREAAKQRKV